MTGCVNYSSRRCRLLDTPRAGKALRAPPAGGPPVYPRHIRLILNYRAGVGSGAVFLSDNPEGFIGHVPRLLYISIRMRGGNEPVMVRSEKHAALGAFRAPVLMQHEALVVRNVNRRHGRRPAHSESIPVRPGDIHQSVKQLLPTGQHERRAVDAPELFYAAIDAASGRPKTSNCPYRRPWRGVLGAPCHQRRDGKPFAIALQ